MTKLTLALNHFLNGYVLNAELAKVAGISKNAYTFWAGVVSARYTNSRVVFLQSQSINDKYSHLLPKCARLDGYVLASAFCDFTGLAPSHLIASNKSSFYNLVKIKSVCGFKFINLKRFYDELGLSYDKQIYIEKSKFFAQNPLEKQIKLTASLSLGYY